MTTGIEFTGSTLTIGANEFSTANRYPRQAANAGDTVLTMVQGPSIAIATVLGSNGGTPEVYFSWRFECGALTFAGTDGSVPVPAAGFAVDKPVGV